MTASICAVLINYNHSEFLPDALRSIINQTVAFDEIIVVDDGSTDESVPIIRAHIDGVANARLIQNPENMGVLYSIDAGLHAASCDYIFYFSADDRYSLEIVQQCKQALKQYPDAAMVSGNASTLNTETGRIQSFTLPFPQLLARYTYKDIEPIARRRSFTFFGGANLIRRSAIMEAGGQRAELKWHADWLLYLIIARRHPFAVIPFEFVQMRQSSSQYSHACWDWKRQRPVLEAIIKALKNEYPEEYPFFRENGLLPMYEARYLWFFIRERRVRHYLTPLLAWRLLMYRPSQIAGRLIPGNLKASLRKMLRV